MCGSGRAWIIALARFGSQLQMLVCAAMDAGDDGMGVGSESE